MNALTITGYKIHDLMESDRRRELWDALTERYEDVWEGATQMVFLSESGEVAFLYSEHLERKKDTSVHVTALKHFPLDQYSDVLSLVGINTDEQGFVTSTYCIDECQPHNITTRRASNG